MAVEIHWGDDEGVAFAFRPGEVIAVGDAAAGFVADLDPEAAATDPQVVTRPEPLEPVRLFAGARDPLSLVREARLAGHHVQPNHVMFAHAWGGGHDCCCCCGRHPSLSSDPMYANPLMANPLMANPLMANPLMANPLMANPLMANIPVRNTAIPVDPNGPEFNSFEGLPADDRSSINVWVIDTGLANKEPHEIKFDNGDDVTIAPMCPDLLMPVNVRISPEPDLPDVIVNTDPTQPPAPLGSPPTIPTPAGSPDQWLDPVAGHGTFIAGVIERLTPGCTIHSSKLIRPGGDADEFKLIELMEKRIADWQAQELDLSRLIINLSFGGPLSPATPAMAGTIAHIQKQGAVVVASAGNDSTCEPMYPAAFPDVVSVGALDRQGPARFTNYGSWVRACTEGVDLVSAFFDEFDGMWGQLSLSDESGTTIATVDPDHFRGWARWSGTSFAAPVVVAALIATMDSEAVDARGAVEKLIDDPNRPRMPCLGTVVAVPTSGPTS